MALGAINQVLLNVAAENNFKNSSPTYSWFSLLHLYIL